VPVSVSVPGRPPSAVCDRGHAFSDSVPSERKRSSVPPSSNAARLQASPFGLRPDKSARRRAAPRRTTHPPPFVGSRRFRTSGRVFLPPFGRYDHQICPSSLQSEKRTQRPKLGAIAPPPLRSDSAGPGSVLLAPRSARRLRRPCRCRSRPLLRPAIRRNLAVAGDRQLTTSRVPRDEALRNSGAPTQRSERRKKGGGRWVKLIPNTFLATKPSAPAPRRQWLPHVAVGPLVVWASRLHVRPGRPHPRVWPFSTLEGDDLRLVMPSLVRKRALRRGRVGVSGASVMVGRGSRSGRNSEH